MGRNRSQEVEAYRALNGTEVSLNKFSSANPPARTIFPENFALFRRNHLTLVLMTGYQNRETTANEERRSRRKRLHTVNENPEKPWLKVRLEGFFLSLSPSLKALKKLSAAENGRCVAINSVWWVWKMVKIINVIKINFFRFLVQRTIL